MSTAPKNTPWGKPQSCILLAEGIWCISTASHGGLKLDRERNARVPAAARQPSGWYEEDCLWSIVTLVFPEHFTAGDRVRAERIAKDSFPEMYTAITGETLTPADSAKLRLQEFERVNFEKFVARAAWGDWAPGIPEGMVRVLARRASTGEESTFLVPAAEYGIRSDSFVIDEARHARAPEYPTSTSP
jgi:hypothetical protein